MKINQCSLLYNGEKKQNICSVLSILMRNISFILTQIITTRTLLMSFKMFCFIIFSGKFYVRSFLAH